MLTAKNLERIMELESKLRSEYQGQLDEKSSEIEALSNEKNDLKASVAKQLEQIKSLSSDATSNKKLEQRNRELHQRCENLQEEIAKLKGRIKPLQKDLGDARAEVTSLKQFDPVRMKKNLDTNKKKLAERTSANETLQKALNKTKAENAQFQQQIKELEEKLSALETSKEVEGESESTTNAA